MGRLTKDGHARRFRIKCPSSLCLIGILTLPLFLAGCGGSGTSLSTYTIGGSVSGLGAGSEVTLANSGGDALAINANGPFTFKTPIVANSSYSVTVSKQPLGQACTISNGSGASISGNVSNVDVVCSELTFTVGGTVAGLASGAQVVLADNGSDSTITANGPFVFAKPVAYNGSYSVTVVTQPVGHVCTVSNAAGAGVLANVASVRVTCSATLYTIGGTLSGLGTGLQVTLSDNGADPLILSASGSFTFKTPVAYNGSYTIAVSAQPTGQTCSVSNGSGASVTANVSMVVVTCSTDVYPIGGTLAGLATGQQVTLYDNGGDALTLNSNGAFIFRTPVAYSGSYSVTVATQPVGQVCAISNGSGAGVMASVSTVGVTCSARTYTIGGTLTGLAPSQQVTLYDNGGDALVLKANGSFTFAAPVAYSQMYAVTVNAQPVGQNCSVANGSGTGVTGNVDSVSVTCVTNTYTIGGTLAGLATGHQLTLNDNGGDALTLEANGPFTFKTAIAYASGYAVTVSSQPAGQACVVANGSGSKVTANVLSVQVNCGGAQPVLQRGYDAGQSGATLTETTLNIVNVTPSTFGRIFSLPVDDTIYAQPLYVPNVAIASAGIHNVLYVATMSDTLYAFDADTGGVPLWSVNLANRMGASPVPIANFAFAGNRNIVGNLGILSTPVIDPATGIMYVVAATLGRGSNTIDYSLHAVDIHSGAEPYGAGVLISGDYGPGPISFNARFQLQRTSLTLAGGQVVVAFSAIEYEGPNDYAGWVMAYDKTNLAQTGTFAAISTGTRGGGVWQSGRPPAVDSAGDVYVFSGNGYTNGYDGVNNFAESVLKLDPANSLRLLDWFTPHNWAALDSADMDLSSSGPMLIPGTGLLTGGGKTGDLYVLNYGNLGKYSASDSGVVQRLSVSTGEIRGGPVYWQRSAGNGGPLLYDWAASDMAKAYSFNGKTLALNPSTQGGGTQAWPGGILALSANGEQQGSGILWANVAVGGDAEGNPPVNGELRAFNAENLSQELWNSTMNSARDNLGHFAKFVPPTVANGRVYMASWDKQVVVYGLL